MGGILKKPKVTQIVQPPPTPPPAPAIEDASQRAQQEGDALRRRKGRASTILASRGRGGSSTGGPSVGTKTLLGQ